MAKYLDMPGLAYFYNQLKNKFALKSDIGSPLKSSTAAGMTDTNRIYVYTGSETGYNAGHWYYYDSGSWHDGGTYNSSAVETDKTLSISDMPADAEVTGDEITDLKSAINANLQGAGWVQYNDGTKISIDSNSTFPAFVKLGNAFELNGSFLTNNNQYYKLSQAGSSNRSTAKSTVKGWPKEVPLYEGHVYRAELNLLSGSYTVVDGSSFDVTIFDSLGGETVIPLNDPVQIQPGNCTISILFHSNNDITFTNAQFVFTIKDITVDDLTTSSKTYSGGINEINQRINETNQHINDQEFPEQNTRNLFDGDAMSLPSGVTYINNELSGTADSISGIQLPIDGVFKSNTQYTVSLSAYTNNETEVTGDGLGVVLVYTDESRDSIYFDVGTSSYSRGSIASNAEKTIDYIYFTWAKGREIVWRVKEIQIEERGVNTPYIPHSTAIDAIAEEKIKYTTEPDIYYVQSYSNAKYSAKNATSLSFDGTRITPTEYIPVKNGDLIRIRNSEGLEFSWRFWKGEIGNGTFVSNMGGTWGTDDEDIPVNIDGFFSVMFRQSLPTPGPIDINDFNGSVSVIRNNVFKTFRSETTSSTHGLAYSWWVNNRVVDSYGTLYFGYISEDAKCGVGCRYTDGTIRRKDLFYSGENDDHNAPSVILLTIDGEEYVCAIGSTGHNTDNKINVFVAQEPNTITCSFTDRTHTINYPDGYKFECSYSQAFFDPDSSKICNFFRIKQKNLTLNTFVMVWMCAISEDYGETWSVYRVFATGTESELFYMHSSDISTNTWTKRILLQTNTTNSLVRPISLGYVNTKTLNILDSSSTNIGKPLTLLSDGELAYDTNITIANYNDFTSLVSPDEYHRYRILDVWQGAFLYAKSVENVQDHHDITDWILYRYKNGIVTEIAHLGLPFFVGSSYVTGATFINDVDCVVYSKNDSTSKDGAHSLHKVILNNNSIVSDEIIKTSDMTIARPVRYDNGNLMYLIGKYREGTGTSYLTWHFNIGFIDTF